MTDNNEDIVTDDLAFVVARLGSKLDTIEKRLAALEATGKTGYLPTAAAGGHANGERTTFPVPTEEGLWNWLGKNAVLPRVATVCFMLVVALLLRTATDNGWLSAWLGTVAGVSYVVVLFACGWRLYAASHSLAPVFSGCGLLLLFSIIAESRFHFSVMPSWIGALLLIFATIAATVVSLRYRTKALLWLATMGSVLVILILNFPNITFPAAAVILLTGTVASINACAHELDKGLRWPVLLASFFLFSIWGFKLDFVISHTAGATALTSLPPTVYGIWFLPSILVFAVFFLVIASRRLFKGIPFGVYGHLLPMASALLVILGGQVIVASWWKRPAFMGIVALSYALFLVGIVLFKKKKQGTDAGVSGYASFGNAAALLLFLAVPWITGELGRSQVFWPLLFLLYLGLSRITGSGNIQFSAVFLAFLTMITGIVSGVYPGREGIGTMNWLATMSGAVAGLGAYFWCRHAPPPVTGFFRHTDRKDLSSLLFLIHGLVSLYFLASLILLTFISDPEAVNHSSFNCGQSILINAGAAILIAWGAIVRRRPEEAILGIVIALIGGVKVFFVDMFHSNELPLVLSVSSFGILAALCSLVLGNWQKICGQDTSPQNNQQSA